jgi:hypothetical protein
MLIGLAAKNAILIVEFAKMEYEKGELSLVEATLKGAQLRLRPILMTSFAFILGCVPLAIASGAGALSRQVMGSAVIGGMLAATCIAIFIIPVTFYVVEKIGRTRATPASRTTPATAVRTGDRERQGGGAPCVSHCSSPCWRCSPAAAWSDPITSARRSTRRRLAPQRPGRAATSPTPPGGSSSATRCSTTWWRRTAREQGPDDRQRARRRVRRQLRLRPLRPLPAGWRQATTRAGSVDVGAPWYSAPGRTIRSAPTTVQLVLNASWEIDIWGRIRRQTEAARAQLLASEEGRRGVILSLVGSVAGAYINLRDLDRQLEIARATAKSRGESYESSSCASQAASSRCSN